MNLQPVRELERQLEQIPPDSENAVRRADLLCDIAMEIRELEQWDRMLALAAEAQALSEEADYSRGIARSITVRAFVEYIRSEYAIAVKHCMEALSFAADDEETEARARSVLAVVQWSLGNYDEAFRHGTYALEVFRRLGDVMNEAFGEAARGGILHSLGRYEEAIEAHLLALGLFRSIGHRVGESRALAGLATTRQAQDKAAEAIEAVRESLRLARESGNALATSRALNDMGEIHAARGDFPQALRCHEEALEIRRREGYRQAEATSLLNLGRLFGATGQHDRAIAVLREGLQIAEEIGTVPKSRDFHHALMAEYDAAGDLTEALRHSRYYIELRAQIASDQDTARQQAIELEAKLLWAQKDAEIQRLRNVELKHALDELQATQAELVNSEKLAALGSLVAALAHEINNPLGVIRSASDVTLRCSDKLAQGDGAALAEILRSNAQLIAQAAERIASVIRRLKNFAGIDQAPYALTSIPDLVENTILLIETEFDTRVKVRRCYGDVPRLHCYAADLGQVLVNLLRNALEAIDGEGTITVTTEADDQWVKVAVADTGRGIAPELIPRLFEAGFNKRESRIKASLSLFASASIVRRHGGEIRVDSRAGEGSTFTILLPRALEHAEQQPA